MNFTNGLAKEEFLQHMFEEFPSVFGNTFSRTMLENIVDYGTADNFTHTKNDLYYFLKDMIPEIEPKDLIPFMDKRMLTDEVLREAAYSRVDFSAGGYEWNVSLDGEDFYSFEVDSESFSSMDTEDLAFFVDGCIAGMQKELQSEDKISLAAAEIAALKNMMFDAWKYHFGIEDRSEEVKEANTSLDEKIHSASSRAALAQGSQDTKESIKQQCLVEALEENDLSNVSLEMGQAVIHQMGNGLLFEPLASDFRKCVLKDHPEWEGYSEYDLGSILYKDYCNRLDMYEKSITSPESQR